jgi:hypothetical protein
VEQPNISPSSAADWKRYYEKKFIEADQQLADLAWASVHLIRFAMSGKKEDAHLLGRRMARRLKFPRDKQPILDELAKWPEYATSILREDDNAGK